MTAGVERRAGPTVWDWLMAALAGFCVLSLPRAIVTGVAGIVERPDPVSVVIAVLDVVASAVVAWWLGLGSWRMTWWARRRHAIGRLDA